jgi:nucleoside-diphosphate-sugar epimerase
MKILVAGLTGQLGHGLVTAARGRDVELLPIVRPIGRRSGAERIRRLFRAEPELAARTVDGDVTAPLWGLPEAQVRELAGTVDVVLDLAAETNWAASARRHARVNVLGAAHGLALARALSKGEHRPLLCYAGSIHAAGGAEGRIPELPFAPDRTRTPYEQSKWLAERALLDPGRRAGVPVLIARVGGLVGDSATGATAKRNSLYMLADDAHLLPARLLPVAAAGRVDMLPRDVAGGLMLQAVVAARESAAAGPAIVHVCAGESAPTTASLLAALRSTDLTAAVRRPRSLPAPPRAITWLSQHLDRVQPLSPVRRNTLMGLRYLTFDRLFERARLRALIAAPLPCASAEQLAQLAFGVPDRAPDPWTGTTLGRFVE